MTAEHLRLEEAWARKISWRKWGPYLSERQWGTIWEDYSEGGDALDYFPTTSLVREPTVGARMLAQEGWTKASIEAFLRDKAKVPFKEFKEQFVDTNMASINRSVPAWAFKITDLEQLVDKPFVDRFLIVVA